MFPSHSWCLLRWHDAFFQVEPGCTPADYSPLEALGYLVWDRPDSLCISLEYDLETKVPGRYQLVVPRDCITEYKVFDV
jgi:hypothetical protein